MTKPKRERAKAKHIRYARKLQRHYNRQWQKIKAEKSAAKASDSSVAATPQEKASDVA